MQSTGWSIRTVAVWLTVCVCGCGDIFPPPSAPLFVAPLSIEGRDLGTAIIDTGGGYELMLQESFGLDVVASARVLAFGGLEVVGVTEGFEYVAGGWPSQATSALVGVSVCECNGVGYEFFRKTGAVLYLDFKPPQASFVSNVPPGGVAIPFAAPPQHLSDFDTSFLRVTVHAGERSRTVLGLLDTGTNATVMQRGLFGTDLQTELDGVFVVVVEPHLGGTAVRAGLFDTEGLPAIILGTDVLSAWSDRWYFAFAPTGGTVTAFPADQPLASNPANVPVAR